MEQDAQRANRMIVQDTAKQIFGTDVPLWISHGPDPEGDGWLHLGYHSDFSPSPDRVKWIILDLGGEKGFDRISLYPVFPYFDGLVAIQWQWRIKGCFFPRAFRIDAADDPSFSRYRTIAAWKDATERCETEIDEDGRYLGTFEKDTQEEPVVLAFEPVRCRFVRIVATQLGAYYSAYYHMEKSKPKHFALALAAVKIMDGDVDIARTSIVSASDILPDNPRYSPGFLVDGKETPLRPAVCFRKEFVAEKNIKRATLKATARGIYRCRINGQDTTSDWFMPEWTDYDSRLMVQTCDVTKHIHEGKNCIGAVVGNGWLFGTWSGGLGVRHPYGCCGQFLACLQIEYADGSREYIPTDGTWRSSVDGPLRRCEFYIGELYDARLEQPGWESPGFDPAEWSPVKTAEHDWQPLALQQHEGIRIDTKYPCLSVRETAQGVYLLDFGKNMLGVCELTLSGYAGKKIRIQYAQALLADGRADTFNLNWEMQRDYLIPAADGKITYTPRFTLHGFRYVEISGLAAPPAPEEAAAFFLHSACGTSGSFSCSNKLLEKIVEAGRQSLLSNRLCFLMDSAARERVGWPTAAGVYSGDLYMNRAPRFYLNMLQNMMEFFNWYEPEENGFAMGAFNAIAPFVYAHRNGQKRSMKGPIATFPFAWSDVVLPLSLHLYEHYGDREFLEKPYGYICALMKLLEKIAPASLEDKPYLSATFGDWLDATTFFHPLWNPRGAFHHAFRMQKFYGVDKQFLGYAFLAHDFFLASRIAGCLSRTEESLRWQEKFQFLKSYFARHFIESSGRLTSHSQGAYALALEFNLIPDEKIEEILLHLDNTLLFTGGRPTTGFVATPLLLKTLSRFGRHGKAVRMMLSNEFPSFGYMIEKGATTIWERWDTDAWQGKEFMNDYNHRDFCGFLDWVWQCLAGIRPDLHAPGFKHFYVAPQPHPDLTWVDARYTSEQGLISVKWELTGDKFTLQVSVPKGTSATILIPEGYTIAAAPDEKTRAGEQEKLDISAGEHAVCAARIDSY